MTTHGEQITYFIRGPKLVLQVVGRFLDRARLHEIHPEEEAREGHGTVRHLLDDGLQTQPQR